MDSDISRLTCYFKPPLLMKSGVTQAMAETPETTTLVLSASPARVTSMTPYISAADQILDAGFVCKILHFTFSCEFYAYIYCKTN